MRWIKTVGILALAAVVADLPLSDGLPWWSGSAAASSAYELDAEACPERALRDCVQLRARPGTAKVDVRFRDAECGTLSLRSTGEQGASGPSPRCWP